MKVVSGNILSKMAIPREEDVAIQGFKYRSTLRNVKKGETSPKP